MERQYRDIYRGFEIDYNPEHSGYHVYLYEKLMLQCSSYDDACMYVDSYIKQNSLALGLRLYQV